MRYSPFQVGRIRRALLDYRLFGSGIPGTKLPWSVILGHIGEYTAYQVADLSIDEIRSEQVQVNIQQERLRKFAIPDRKGRYQNPPPQLMQSLVEFLCHPEIAFLPEIELLPDEMDFSIGLQLSKFVKQSKNDLRDIDKIPRQFAGIGYSRREGIHNIFLQEMQGHQIEIENGASNLIDIFRLSSLDLENSQARAVELTIITAVRGSHIWKNGRVFQKESLFIDRCTGTMTFFRKRWPR